MGITPAVIQQKEFSKRFRGFDTREVHLFFEEVALEVEDLNRAIHEIKHHNHLLDLENQGYKTRETSIQRALLHSEKILDQMKSTATKSAETIIADAELEAERILSKAHQRLSQLYSDITELKRQRMQIEVQISSVIESHSKLLEMSKEENKTADETETTLRFLKQA